MNSIGGYFELELRQGEHYHPNALQLNTARNCLEYILRARRYQKVYIPYYTCEVILEPINKLQVSYEFYPINHKLEPVNDYKLSGNEAFLYTNYFGLKQDTVRKLANSYGKNLIVDSSQAFYAKPIEGTDTFYSARKFFGVPDGAYLYTDQYLDETFAQDISYTRMLHLCKRIDRGAEFGYDDFKRNDGLLSNQPIKKMSKLTAQILKSIDYYSVKEKRRANYLYLANRLGSRNRLSFDLTDEDVPMVYPFWGGQENLKLLFIQHKIFVATYWSNVLEWLKEEDGYEKQLTNDLAPLPIDQRLNINNLDKICSVISTAMTAKLR